MATVLFTILPPFIPLSGLVLFGTFIQVCAPFTPSYYKSHSGLAFFSQLCPVLWCRFSSPMRLVDFLYGGQLCPLYTILLYTAQWPWFSSSLCPLYTILYTGHGDKGLIFFLMAVSPLFTPPHCIPLCGLSPFHHLIAYCSVA